MLESHLVLCPDSSPDSGSPNSLLFFPNISNIIRVQDISVWKVLAPRTSTLTFAFHGVVVRLEIRTESSTRIGLRDLV